MTAPPIEDPPSVLDSLPPSAWQLAHPDLVEAEFWRIVRNTVALVIRKGGAGKTTKLALLADALSRMGLNVLVIDTDPQGNTSDAFGCEVQLVPDGTDRLTGKPKLTPDRFTVGDVIASAEPGVAGRAIQPAKWNDMRLPDAAWDRGGPLDGHYGVVGIIPCFESIENDAMTWTPADLYNLRTTLATAPAGEVPPNVRWDVVLIDTPPGGTNIGRQACLAAHHCLLVTNAEPFGMKAVPKTLTFIDDIRFNYQHPSFSAIGLVLNEFIPTSVENKEQIAGFEELQALGRAASGTQTDAPGAAQTGEEAPAPNREEVPPEVLRLAEIMEWPARMANRTVVPRSQSYQAPMSRLLAMSDNREAATVLCQASELNALRLLDEIGHPRAAEIRALWSTKWPTKKAS